MKPEPVLDPAAIERLREWGGPSLPQRLIEIFLSQVPGRMELIQSGGAGRDAHAVETGAHSLKSSAGNLGAVRLQRLAGEAEALARDGRMEELVDRLGELEEAFTSACEELRSLLERMKE